MAKLFIKRNKGDSPSTKRDCTNEMTLLILGTLQCGLMFCDIQYNSVVFCDHAYH